MGVVNGTFKTTVIGLGGAGCKIATRLSAFEAAKWLQLAVMDTDANALASSEPLKAFPLGSQWSYSEGCGGDCIKGERSVSSVRNEIKEYIQTSSLLLVVGGMGGGCCSGGAPVLARVAGECGVPAIFVVTTPFMFEGQVKRETAENGINQLLVDADIVLPVPNDILFTSIPADSPAREAFKKSDESLAEAVFGIAEIMRCDKLLSADFADLREMVFKKQSVCNIGTGAASEDDADRCSAAVGNLLSSPLLGGAETLKKADAMLVTVVGGDDFTIGEMKQTLDMVRNLSGDQTIITAGVNSDPARRGKLLVTVVAVQCDDLRGKREAMIFAPSQTSSLTGVPSENDSPPDDGSDMFQPEWVFQSPNRGYFSKTAPNPVKVDDDDVDVPTFQRKNITIDKGA
jgi:cell division protein FtsZ